MRLDKFLKISRVIKRRTVANEISSSGRVDVNGRQAKPGTRIAAGDIIEIHFGTGSIRIRVLGVSENVKKAQAGELYEILGSASKEDVTE